MKTIGFPSVPLGNLCRVQSGYAFKSSDWQTSGVPVVQIGNVRPRRIDLEGCKFVSEEVASMAARFRLKEGDILISMTGHIGVVGKVLTTRAIMLNQRVGRLEDINTSALLPEYLFQVLQAPDIRSMLVKLGHGAAQPNISPKLIGTVEIPLPPLDAQRRIGSVLGAYDDLLEVNRRRIAQLEKVAEKLFEEWFVRFRFPGHENVPIVATPEGKLPAGWRRLPFGTVAANFDRLRRPLSGQQRLRMQGPYPYYGAAKVFDYIDSYIFDGLHLLVAEDGSVITPDGFPVLQLVDGKFWVNNHAHVVKGAEDVSTEFLYLTLKRQPVQGYITGAAQPKITQGNLNRITVIVGDAALMKQFSAIASNLFSLALSLRRTNELLSASRDLLLPRLISGQLSIHQAERELEEAA